MSVSGISSTNFFNYTTQSSQTQRQQFTQEFQQLGADLQSGNLSAAQADFATLQQTQTTNSTSSAQSSNPIAQLFNQLSQDLKSGNLSAAQQDYSAIQQDFQSLHAHHRHSHRAANGGEVTQLFDQLGQDLESGNLAAAQQAYNAMAADLPRMNQSSGGGLTGQAAESTANVSTVA